MNLCVQLSMYFFVHLFLDMWVLILFYTSQDSMNPHYDDILTDIWMDVNPCSTSDKWPNTVGKNQ